MKHVNINFTWWLTISDSFKIGLLLNQSDRQVLRAAVAYASRLDLIA